MFPNKTEAAKALRKLRADAISNGGGGKGKRLSPSLPPVPFKHVLPTRTKSSLVFTAVVREQGTRGKVYLGRRTTAGEASAETLPARDTQQAAQAEAETPPATETHPAEARRPAGVPETPCAPLRGYVEERSSNLRAGDHWSTNDLKTLARKNPKISIGDATAWVTAETRGPLLRFTVKYMLPGEKRQNLGSSTFHPRYILPNGEECYDVEAFLTIKVFQRAIEHMSAQNLPDAQQWHRVFEEAKKAVDDVLGCSIGLSV